MYSKLNVIHFTFINAKIIYIICITNACQLRAHRINGYPTPIANPMSGYPMYAGTRKTWGINALGTLVVEVRGRVRLGLGLE